MIELLEKMLEERSIHTENKSGGCIKYLITGIYQANLLIAKHFLIKQTTGIVCSDGDFSVMIGKSLFQINKFHFD